MSYAWLVFNPFYMIQIPRFHQEIKEALDGSYVKPVKRSVTTPQEKGVGVNIYLSDLLRNKEKIPSLLKKFNFTWIRTEIPLSFYISKSPKLEELRLFMRKNKWIRFLGVAGSWTEGSKKPPKNLTIVKDFADYIETFPKNLRLVEFWNEPNLTIFWRDSIKKYAKLFYTFASAFNGHVGINFSWLFGWNIQFLEKLERYKVVSNSDFVSLHLYDGFLYPGDAQTFRKKIRLTKAFVRRVNPKARIYLTEFGFPSFTTIPLKILFPPSKQKRILAEYLQVAKDEQIELILFYCFFDPHPRSLTLFQRLQVYEHGLGILDRFLKRKE